MKISNQIEYKKPPAFKASPGAASKFLMKNTDIGEATSIAIDIMGKGLLVPLVIIFNGFSKQSKEEKKYSAIKNPISALMELGLEVPIFYLAGSVTRNLANKGLLDKSKDFSFNSKLYKENFLEIFDKLKHSSPPKHIDYLKSNLKKRRVKNNVIQGFEQIISSSGDTLNKQAKNAFDNYKIVNKRLFHLESRFGFIATLAAVPLVCALENWLHPKVMKYFKEKKAGKVED